MSRNTLSLLTRPQKNNVRVAVECSSKPEFNNRLTQTHEIKQNKLQYCISGAAAARQGAAKVKW